MSTPLFHWIHGAYTALAASALLLISGAISSHPMGTLSAKTPDLTAVQLQMGSLSIPFEHNQGQYDDQVAYVARTFAGGVFVTRDGRIVHALAGPQQTQEVKQSPRPVISRAGGWSLTETLEGATVLTPVAGKGASTRVSRLIGNPSGAWSNNAPTFQSVELGQAWPGISVELVARGSNVEKLFTVAPGAQAQAITVRLDGAQTLRLGSEGQLIAKTGNGDIVFTPPVAFQEKQGQRIDIPVRYALLDEKRYGFVLGDYDATQPVVIDPLMQSTYLGGSLVDQIYSMVVDGAGQIVVGGFSSSVNFPGTTGGAQPNRAGSSDAFVALLSADLTTLLQATYLGGSGTSADQIEGVVLDSTGHIVVAGYTNSSDFPGTAGGAQSVSGGGTDGFVARLSADLTTLVQATYLGGSGSTDQIKALALNSTGQVVVAGYTNSSNFPGTTGGGQPVYGGSQDGFLALLSADLTTLVQATYVGGSSSEITYALAFDGANRILVTGQSSSTNLPGTVGGAQPARSGFADAFVSLFSADLTTLVRATYLGGGVNEVAYALAVNSTGQVVVAGYTTSSDFPGTTGGAQPVFGGSQDGFVALLGGDLSTLVQATYLGGSGGIDQVHSIIIESSGQMVVAGYTASADFPGMAGGAQPASGGSTDGFVSRLSGDLTSLVQSTYLGGSGSDFISTMVVDGAGRILVAGETSSSNLPGTAGGAQSVYGGGLKDAFVARISADLRAVSSQTINFPAQASQNYSPGGTFAISPEATASSSLAVTYASTTPAVCAISGNIVTMVALGTCTITADQAGNGSFNPAPQVSQSISIVAAVLNDQTISFPVQASQIYRVGGNFVINPPATASSGLPVTYTSTTPAVCTISGSSVSMVALGTCSIAANQAGNPSFNAAPQVVQNIAIVQGPTAKAIPTLSQSMLVVLGLLLAFVAVIQQRRRL